jgi:hypothetical protein
MFAILTLGFSEIIQQSVPDTICEAFLSWTLCTYFVDPITVSVIAVGATAVAIFLYVRKNKRPLSGSQS